LIACQHNRFPGNDAFETARRNEMVGRREFLYGLGATLGGGILLGANRPARADDDWSEKLIRSLAALEKERGGRLGVAVTDTSSGRSAAYRGDERFALCSTFKVLAAAAILARVDAGKEQLDRRIRFEAKDVVVNSPVSKNHVGGDGMSLAEICEAAITLSDNTAGNLLLANLNGPEGLTAYARSLGDTVTRLDRNEPDLNEAIPADVRDTTSASAMLSDLRALIAGNALTSASRERLVDWLVGNKTGDARLRAGFPREWRVGDKTGSGERGTTNDVAVVWPSANRSPLFVSVYLTGSSPEADHRNATLATVARLIAGSV
jgi:beta-lactamase class A